MMTDLLAELKDVDADAGKGELWGSGLTSWCFVHGLAMLIVDNKIVCPDTSEPAFLAFIFKMFATAYTNGPAAA